ARSRHHRPRKGGAGAPDADPAWRKGHRTQPVPGAGGRRQRSSRGTGRDPWRHQPDVLQPAARPRLRQAARAAAAGAAWIFRIAGRARWRGGSLAARVTIVVRTAPRAGAALLPGGLQAVSAVEGAKDPRTPSMVRAGAGR